MEGKEIYVQGASGRGGTQLGGTGEGRGKSEKKRGTMGEMKSQREVERRKPHDRKAGDRDGEGE